MSEPAGNPEMRATVTELLDMYGADLAGVAEIAEELGVPRTNISMWDARRRTSGFPEPVARLAAGPVYNMIAIRAWWADRQSKREPV